MHPGIFTDAYCYLPWIAATYGMKLPKHYTSKQSCGKSKGRRNAINEMTCLGQDAENLNRGRCKDWQQSGKYPSEYECQQEILLHGKPLKLPDTSTELELKPRQCDFENHQYTQNGMNMKWDRCLLEAREGYTYNIYMCKVMHLQEFSFLPISGC